MNKDTENVNAAKNRASPRAHRPFRVFGLFQEFAHAQASSGIVLMVCVIVAIVWANSPFGSSYYDLWHLHIAVKFGDVHWLNDVFDQPLEYWINDGLMAIFFFVVGLEIKREVIAGELASCDARCCQSWRLSVACLCPLHLPVVQLGGPAQRGWGIPMATDIAFTLGVMAVLGSRVPTP